MDEQQGQQPEGSNGGPHVELDPPVPAAYAGVGAEEIAEGKAMAILSYAINFIQLPFFLVPLIMRNNQFSLFHAKQCFMIWIVGLVGIAAGIALSFVCIGVLVFPIVGLFILIVNIIGLINAAQGQFKPLPVIGPLADKWFAGIGKQG